MSDRYEVNLAYPLGGMYYHWGRVIFDAYTPQKELDVKMALLKEMFEPKGYQLSLTRWLELGESIEI